MQTGYLIGVTTSGETRLIESGDPREMRRLFKHSDGAGLVSLEVVESAGGRTRRRRYLKNAAAAEKSPKKPSSK